MALSGGVDSMSCLHFLIRGKRLPKVIVYIDHNTGHSKETISKISKFLTGCNIQMRLLIRKIEPQNLVLKQSKEEYWRTERLKIFSDLYSYYQVPIITGHTLDDCVEQYVMGTLALNNFPKTLEYNGPYGIIRPFRTWKKSKILQYAKRYKIDYAEDVSNTDTTLVRNYVRHILIPAILKVNPGLYKLVRNQIT